MRRTLTRVAIATFSALGLAATAGFSYAGAGSAAGDGAAAGAGAPAGVEGQPRVPDGMLAAMQRDLGLDRDTALSRIVAEREAAETEQRLRGELGTTYAGAWVDRQGDLHVATTEPLTSAEADRIDTAGAVPERAEHSTVALDRAMERLNEAPRPDRTVPGWYVDVRTNTVVVQAHPDGRQAAEQLVADAGVDPDRVRIQRTTMTPEPLYDVRGGDAYYMGGGGRCSIGFPVDGGFVTAGHCGDAGTGISGHNQVSLGSVAQSTFPGRDYAWVRITDNEWQTTPYVNDYSGGTVTVQGSQEASVGAQVCRSGSTTGWQCGTIQAKNQTVNYPQGTVRGLTQTTACAEGGDSGGSWLAGQQAQGVTSGGSGNCSSGGTTFFQPLTPILSAYGLSLVTDDDGGGGDPPPPGEGSWTPGTSYSVGDTVTYEGVEYSCLQAHTARTGWEPPNTPALWQRT